jgi:hypothetical protein
MEGVGHTAIVLISRRVGTSALMSELKQQTEETLDEAARGRKEEVPVVVLGSVLGVLAILVAVVVAITLTLYFLL